MSNSVREIHETVLKDIIDIFDDLQDIDPEKVLGSRRSPTSFSSLPKATSNLTLVFPAICATSGDINNMAMISKAHERKCVTMLQMLFSAFQLGSATNAAEFIAQFHSNLSTKVFSVDDLFGLMNEFAYDDIVKKKIHLIKEDMRNLGYIMPSDINESSIGDYTVNRTRYGQAVVNEGAASNRQDRGKTRSDIIKNIATARKDMYDTANKQVLDGDIKKANELMPTMMAISFMTTGADGKEVVTLDNIVIGVKCKLYPIASDDIISHLVTKTADRNWITQLIRASTREISFWKDFIFMIDRAKVDALSLSRRGSASKMWKVLERRSFKSKLRRLFGSANDATAITSVIITQNEVEYMLKNEGINIEDPNVARHLMEGLNLMALIVVDESMEIAKFLYDTGDDMWETISFNHLERESNDNTYKKVVNLMTKYNR